MLRCKKNQRIGFTLVELAIVLGVTGLLFGGLWRLLSTGNLQMRDQATASQQAQLIGAISTYLQSSEGQTYMGAQTINPFVMVLPTYAAGTSTCTSEVDMTAAPATHAGLCSVLPPGFTTTTVNPYGQTYQVAILKDSTPSPAAPKSYSFMILTKGGDAIPDTSGGRISSMIGGDGGFVYTNNVCNSLTGSTSSNSACGAYGSWNTTVSTYGLSASSGVVASRTYYSPTQSQGSSWLARVAISGDSTYVYNTMQTPFYLGASTNSLYLGSYGNPIPTTGGGAINMQGGTINVQGGTIALGPSGEITGSAGTGGAGLGGGTINLIGNMMPNGTGSADPVLQLTGGCTVVSTPNCGAVAQITNGDLSVAGQITTTNLYSSTFVYQGSDMRLKTNIKDLTDSLVNVMKLKPVSFAYKINGKESMGVIAQDLEKIYPQLVAQGANGMKAVSYDGLIAPLIGAVQELKKENNDLRDQLKTQAVKQEKIEQELTALRQK